MNARDRDTIEVVELLVEVADCSADEAVDLIREHDEDFGYEGTDYEGIRCYAEALLA